MEQVSMLDKPNGKELRVTSVQQPFRNQILPTAMQVRLEADCSPVECSDETPDLVNTLIAAFWEILK